MGLGVGKKLERTAVTMMEPVDQIEYARTLDPEIVRKATMETMSISYNSGEPLSWAMSTAEDCAVLQDSDLDEGLTTELAQERLAEVGRNELAKSKPKPFGAIWAAQLTNGLLLCTFTCGLLSFFVLPGKQVQGSVMIGCFFVMSFINAVCEHSNAEGMTALRGMTAASARVMRDGVKQDVPAAELVPGDIVYVAAGGIIPADMRVATATDLCMDEAALTGESEQAKKTVAPETCSEVPFPSNMMFSSTLCVGGAGIGVVTSTGMNTQVGQIALRLNVQVIGLSPLERTMSSAGGYAILVVLGIVLTIGSVSFIMRDQDPSSEVQCKEDEINCFLATALVRGLLIGVAAVPKEMPLMVTLLLLSARWAIQQKQALVRKASAIETLGCCTVICSDKTGTLTEGKMTTLKAAALSTDGVQRFSFYPTAGYDPRGGVFKESELGLEEARQVSRCVAEGRTDYPVRNYGEPQSQSGEPDVDVTHVRALLTAASLNCYGACLRQVGNTWTADGNMSETALVVAAAKAGIGSPCQGLALEKVSDTYGPEPELEVPFSSSRKLMCTVHKTPKGRFAGVVLPSGSTHVAIVKGAPDRLLPMSGSALRRGSGGTLTVEKGFGESLTSAMLQENDSMAQATLRVMLVCIRPLSSSDMRDLQAVDADERVTLLTKSMAVLGAFGIADPPRPAVKGSIATCKGAGIRVVMITGDQQATAQAVGTELDIVQDDANAKLCSDLYGDDGELLPEDELDQMCGSVTTWSRAKPADKATIIASLQRLGHTVAMTGDGVNDAPALKLADIGVSMGITGTEVAKGAADIVLMNDDFTTIVEAVVEGRRAWTNVQVYVSFMLAVVVQETLAAAVAVLTEVALPVEGLQIMILNILAHMPALTLCATLPVKSVMAVPPRRKSANIVSRGIFIWFVVPWILGWTHLWIGLSLVGHWMHTGFTHTSQLAGSSHPNALIDHMAACQFAGQEVDGKFERDPRPFRCSCRVRHHPFAHPEWRNSSASGFAQADVMVCAGNADHLCWSPRVQPKLLETSENCARTGSMVARAMTLLGGVVGELSYMLVVSSEDPIFYSVCRNKLLLAAVIGVSTVLLTMIRTPVVAAVLDLRTPPLASLITALMVPVLAVVGVEILKLGYRVRRGKLLRLRKIHAEMASMGLVNAWAGLRTVRNARDTHARELQLPIITYP